MLGLLDAKLSQVVAKRRSHFFFEQSSEVILADPQRFTEFRQGKRWICEFFTKNRECSIYAQIPCLFHHSKSSPPWLSPAYYRFQYIQRGLRARIAEVEGRNPQDEQLAMDLGINVTPSVFVNGRRMNIRSVDDLRTALRTAILESNEATTCWKADTTLATRIRKK